jgi:hypothetical protein
MNRKLNLVQINTTAYSEEDFLLLTDLTETQIKKVINPIVKDERENEVPYENGDLVGALRKAYPSHTIIDYTLDNIYTISI